MAALVLKAFSLGVEKLPDKAFEALPGGYFKAKEKDRRDKEQRDYERKRDGKRDRRGDKSNRRRYNSVPPSRVDYDDYAGHESDDLNARSSRRRHRTDYARDSSPDYDRGRRHNTKGYGAAPSNMDSYAVPRPYNPAEYGRPPTAAPVPSYPSAYPTQGYHQAYQSHPQEPSSAARRYSPPSSYTPSPVNQPAYQPPSNPPYSSTYVPPSAVPSATKTTYPNEAYASYRRYDDGYDTSRRRGSVQMGQPMY
ncbi:hypothetical protein M501DRAFT_738920 [Patellaria atrata CBS 101060]|uniref:Uncharacterized protein n=1 Tax=Patellaria atrata CBS 101060 TaxID=1346257 RepID=A0A9P4SC11_9PEZI|nr:hypothetical protein M501DRAFT_738920 [Patellaria atrata CBS 101060]